MEVVRTSHENIKAGLTKGSARLFILGENTRRSDKAGCSKVNRVNIRIDKQI